MKRRLDLAMEFELAAIYRDQLKRRRGRARRSQQRRQREGRRSGRPRPLSRRQRRRDRRLAGARRPRDRHAELLAPQHGAARRRGLGRLPHAVLRRRRPRRGGAHPRTRSLLPTLPDVAAGVGGVARRAPRKEGRHRGAAARAARRPPAHGRRERGARVQREAARQRRRRRAPRRAPRQAPPADAAAAHRVLRHLAPRRRRHRGIDRETLRRSARQEALSELPREGEDRRRRGRRTTRAMYEVLKSRRFRRGKIAPGGRGSGRRERRSKPSGTS